MNKYEIETLRKRMAEKERKEREYFERRAKEEMEKQRKEKEDAIAKKKKEREDADKAERHRIWKTMGQNYFNRMLLILKNLFFLFVFSYFLPLFLFLT